jgi:hypothetical protein
MAKRKKFNSASKRKFGVSSQQKASAAKNQLHHSGKPQSANQSADQPVKQETSAQTISAPLPKRGRGRPKSPNSMVVVRKAFSLPRDTATWLSRQPNQSDVLREALRLFIAMYGDEDVAEDVSKDSNDTEWLDEEFDEESVFCR